jgi:hypothetical protein
MFISENILGIDVKWTGGGIDTVYVDLVFRPDGTIGASLSKEALSGNKKVVNGNGIR